jgi:hypothetical protein
LQKSARRGTFIGFTPLSRDFCFDVLAPLSLLALAIVLLVLVLETLVRTRAKHVGFLQSPLPGVGCIIVLTV